MELVAEVRRVVAEHEMLPRGEMVVLGVSGGPDSLVMLHVLNRLAPEFGAGLHVGHLHHGIRGEEADADARFVENICQQWGVPCTLRRADVPSLAVELGLALEEAARRARYAFLAELARSLGARSVAVAHNADDQVETVLMHFLRGSGLAGLRGMRPVSPLEEMRLGGACEDDLPPKGQGIRLLRPLLSVPRAEIERYVRQQGLRPRFDRSNLDRTFFRNRLRHELIPYLESYNPNIREVVRRTAEVLAGDYDVLRDLLYKTWPIVVRAESAGAIVYDLVAFRGQPLGMQRSLLREGVHRLRRSLRNINWVHIDDAVAVARGGETGAQATLPRGLMLTLGYDEMTLADIGYEPPARDRPWVTERLPLSREGSVPLPGSDWVINLLRVSRGALAEAWRNNPDPYVAYLDADLAGERLALRPRRAGDRFRPLGLGGYQSVRDYMINAKIPSRERDRVPLLVDERDRIVWIVGHRVDERYAITADTHQVLVVRVEKVDRHTL
ncbi:MAG: tRNA lysidine(34) synthetase TilS [Chloroflexi bacterium]|nr:tRNA lysidine(34) synthetase TilS [Chloroflexota bacterium]